MSAPEKSYPDGYVAETEVTPLSARRRPPRYSRWLLGLAAAVALVLAVALPMRFFGAGDATAPAGQGTPGLPQSPLTGVGIPYLALDRPGWEQHGFSMTRTSGLLGYRIPSDASRQRLVVTWAPTWEKLSIDLPEIGFRVGVLVPDEVLSEPEPVTVYGLKGELRHGKADYVVTFPYQDTQFSVIGLDFATRDAFYAVVSGLGQVNPEEFVARAPADQILPDQQAPIIEELLSRMEIPGNYRRERLMALGSMSRAALLEQVTGSVGCAWIDGYNSAYDNGDERAMARVTKAVRGIQTVVTQEGGGMNGDWAEGFDYTMGELEKFKHVNKGDVFAGRCGELP